MGMIDKRVAIAPQKMAPGTPATNSPSPVRDPCTTAIRKEPLTVARMVEIARSASIRRSFSIIGTRVMAARLMSRPLSRKKKRA